LPGRSYRGDEVRYAKAKNASARFTFVGSKVAWYGPTGPTRGRAKVYVDGKYVRTVDLRPSTFRARTRLFSRSWSQPGSHSLTIRVVGTSGRPTVAIDEFLVWD
jgi:hypothetical protein